MPVFPKRPLLRGVRSGLVVGPLWVEEFEGAFADLPRPIAFVLDVAACGRDVVVADEASNVFEVE